MVKKAEIKLYGDIFTWNENSANIFVAKLEELKKGNGDVTVRMHCYGGSVFEGNVIGNAIEQDSKVIIQIDGLAASMGAFILPYAKKVSIVENGFVMLHAPESHIRGSSDTLEKEIKLLRSFESNFIAKLMAKTKQPEEVVKSWLVGENYFTAQEAKDLGLVDEIIKQIAKVEILAKSEAQNYTAQTMYDRFTAFLEKSNTHFLNKKEMDKNQLIAKFGLTGVTAESSDAEITAAIEKKIADERSAKDTAVAALATEKQKQITALVESAVTAKKITETEKAHFVAIGNGAGIEALNTALNAIKVTPTITGMLGSKGEPTGEITKFDELVAKGSDFITAFKKENKEQYNALFKAEFGHEPTC
ncbi:MAG: Clp protease ClpP [Prevotellaceae bacterium]|jgi:ATP-dependent protease ClpP protease subunit|nr:Clp protease ClpP [Prevotellaceae bacterium]